MEQLGPDDTANGRDQRDVARALPRMHGDGLLLRGLEPLLDILLPTEPAHDHAHQNAEKGIPGPAEQMLLGRTTTLEQVRGIDQKPKHLPAEYESKQTAGHPRQRPLGLSDPDRFLRGWQHTVFFLALKLPAEQGRGRDESQGHHQPERIHQLQGRDLDAKEILKEEIQIGVQDGVNLQAS